MEHNNGQAFVAACKSGAADILEMLLSGGAKPPSKMLSEGFQAASELPSISDRFAIFKLLLPLGLDGDAVDAQLVVAGRRGEDGQDLVRLLLSHGASPDYNEGEVVEEASKSGSLGTLEMLLGIAELNECQKRMGVPARHQRKRPIRPVLRSNPPSAERRAPSDQSQVCPRNLTQPGRRPGFPAAMALPLGRAFPSRAGRARAQDCER